ncbi:hypothetical protein DPSP01_008076 [Paraphaeosphaeria sporulosa]|uniref:Mid2 domain-containing protein n=1 Tax=Paraphaeosphaeria sporulosa TaxID=1460663 RepID=A0A177CQ79_9PLEO|nr:uncharacterized protein CC84DRAFT_1204134 [Paraphaeosphaeria sporulosa]OAG08907.1 hypothetical protein CC84DRAFT_1204134 [Paraphaeosphaeria sporulosa]
MILHADLGVVGINAPKPSTCVRIQVAVPYLHAIVDVLKATIARRREVMVRTFSPYTIEACPGYNFDLIERRGHRSYLCLRKLKETYISIIAETSLETLSTGTSSTSDLFISPSSPLVQIATIVTVSAGKTLYTTITEYSAPISQSTSDLVSADQDSSSKEHMGAIVGGTLGGVVLLAAAVFLLFLLRKRRRTKEERRATISPAYPVIQGGEDMSEQLTGTPISSAGTKNIAGDSAHTSSESVPQLDGIAIIPPNEIGSDALGIIPELPANEKDSSKTSRTSKVAEVPQAGNSNGGRVCRDPNNHVMSWANLNSMGNRNAMSRLSQPHAIPEGGVWENMSPTKNM